MLHVARSICDAPRWLGLWAQLPLQENSVAPARKYTGHPCTKGVRSACTNGETRMSVTPSAFHSLVASSTAPSRTACSAFFSLLAALEAALPGAETRRTCHDRCVFCSMHAKNGAKRAAAHSDDEPFASRSSTDWARDGMLLHRRLELRTRWSWKGCIR